MKMILKAFGVAASVLLLASCQTAGTSSVTPPSIEQPVDVGYDELSHPFSPKDVAFNPSSTSDIIEIKQHVAMFMPKLSSGSYDDSKAIFILAPTMNYDDDRKDITAWVMNNSYFGNDRLGLMYLYKITGKGNNWYDASFDKQNLGNNLWEDLGIALPDTARIYNFDINAEITSSCYISYFGDEYSFVHYINATLDDVNAYYASEVSLLLSRCIS